MPHNANSRSGPTPRRRAALAAMLALLLVGGAWLVAKKPGLPTLPSITFDAGGYVGSQILAIVNSRIEPHLAFDYVTFDPPGTARIEGVTLTAPGGTTILEAAGLAVSLAEPPARGRPIKIEKISVSNGVIRLIGDGRGGLVGFSNFTADPARQGAPAETPTTPPDESPYRLSDVLVLRHVELENIAVEYRENRTADPLRFDHITSAMDIHPEGPGWHTIAFSSGRSPGLVLDLSGRVNLDTLDIEADNLTASIDAGPDTIATLPSPLASLLEQAEIRGRIDATGSAEFNAHHPTDGSARLTIHGVSLHAAANGYQIPIDSLDIEASLTGGLLDIKPIASNLLGGTVRGNAEIRLNETGTPARADFTAENINLRDALSRPDQADPKLAGILSASVHARTALDTPKVALTGGGTVAVTKGRLVMLPGLTQLSDLVSGVGLKTGASNHRGSAVFTLGPSGATITESEVVTNTLAARATGTIGFDHTLNLRVNAGPMEKIQNLLGAVGDLIANVTDRLVKYTIKGTIENPQVGVAPLGFD